MRDIQSGVPIPAEEQLRLQISLFRQLITAAQLRARVADGAIRLATEKSNKLDSLVLMLRLSRLEKLHSTRSRDGPATEQVAITAIIPKLNETLKVNTGGQHAFVIRSLRELHEMLPLLRLQIADYTAEHARIKGSTMPFHNVEEVQSNN